MKDFLFSLNEKIDTKVLANGNVMFSLGAETLKFSGICNETMLNATISSNNDVIYDEKAENKETDVIKEKLSNIFKFYEETQKVIDDGKVVSDLELRDDSEEILLDDVDETKTDTENESQPLENVPNLEEKSDLEDIAVSIKDLKDLQIEVSEVADKASKILKRYGVTDSENRLTIIGLVSQLYEVAENVSQFIEHLSDTAETQEISKEVEESLSVPTKVDYMQTAVGAISQACQSLRKQPEVKDLLDVLKDVRSEMILRK